MIAKRSQAFARFVWLVVFVSVALAASACGDAWTADEGSAPASESSAQTERAPLCPHVMMCMRGLRWDSTCCACVSKTMPEPVACVPPGQRCRRGWTWDAHHHRCTPRADAPEAADEP